MKTLSCVVCFAPVVVVPLLAAASALGLPISFLPGVTTLTAIGCAAGVIALFVQDYSAPAPRARTAAREPAAAAARRASRAEHPARRLAAGFSHVFAVHPHAAMNSR